MAAASLSLSKGTAIKSRPVFHDPGSETGAKIEDDRIMAEWIEASRERFALKSELDHPTASRLYDAQVKLVHETDAARDKCHSLVFALRAHRKGSRQAT